MTDAKLLPGGKAGQVPKPSSETIPGFFARGVSYYKLFWVFFIASFLGAITETLFMLLTRGELQNRSGLIYGQFSLVWGLGAVLFTVCFHRLTGRRDLVIFLAGTVLGGAYEYLCSWVQEVLFGACFWDYSHIPLNINGRVSLLYSMFWGVAAVLWVKDLYPRMCRWIGRIPGPIGNPSPGRLRGSWRSTSCSPPRRWPAGTPGRWAARPKTRWTSFWTSTFPTGGCIKTTPRSPLSALRRPRRPRGWGL